MPPVSLARKPSDKFKYASDLCRILALGANRREPGGEIENGQSRCKNDSPGCRSPSSDSLEEREQRGVLLDGERQFDVGSDHSPNCLDLFAQDDFEMLDVAGTDLQPVAEVARDRVALLN